MKGKTIGEILFFFNSKLASAGNRLEAKSRKSNDVDAIAVAEAPWLTGGSNCTACQLVWCVYECCGLPVTVVVAVVACCVLFSADLDCNLGVLVRR